MDYSLCAGMAPILSWDQSLQDHRGGPVRSRALPRSAGMRTHSSSHPPGSPASAKPRAPILPATTWEQMLSHRQPCEVNSMQGPPAPFAIPPGSQNEIHRALQGVQRRLRGVPTHTARCRTGPAACWPDATSSFQMKVPRSLTPVFLSGDLGSWPDRPGWPAGAGGRMRIAAMHRHRRHERWHS